MDNQNKEKDIFFHGTCDVCGKEDAVAVVCSSLGAISFKYCKECLQCHREPYSAILGAYTCCDVWERKEFYKQNEKVMQEFYHKSLEEFLHDLKVCDAEYEQYIRAE